MTLEAAFTALDHGIDNLSSAFGHLLWAVVEAQPGELALETEEGGALVGHYERVTHDLVGLVQEMEEAVKRGGKRNAGRIEAACFRRMLIECQDRFNRLSASFNIELVGYDSLQGLNSLDRGNIGVWAQGVKDALENCQQPLFNFSQTLFLSWQEVTDRSTGNAVSVRTTNIGQQITVRGRPAATHEAAT